MAEVLVGVVRTPGLRQEHQAGFPSAPVVVDRACQQESSDQRGGTGLCFIRVAEEGGESRPTAGQMVVGLRSKSVDVSASCFRRGGDLKKTCRSHFFWFLPLSFFTHVRGGNVPETDVVARSVISVRIWGRAE